jgi:hypothetical protein
MQNAYQRNGYETRAEYLQDLADEHGVDIQVVLTLADLMGPTEDFDGLVCELEDYVYLYG